MGGGATEEPGKQREENGQRGFVVAEGCVGRARSSSTSNCPALGLERPDRTGTSAHAVTSTVVEPQRDPRRRPARVGCQNPGKMSGWR